MKSLWSESVSLKKYNSLDRDISVNTVVIGGGIAGLLTAYKLNKREIDTVLIEADRICSGQTKNTTAKITSQHGVIYSKILSFYGQEAAKEYADANQKAISEYEHIIKSDNIRCGFERKNAVLYAMNDKKIIEKEFEAAKAAGIDCYTENRIELPFPVQSALVFRNQAQFNPLEFLSSISEQLRIFEKTKAIKIENGTVITDKGNITAENIVLACHFPFVNFPGLYFLKINQERSYAVSSKWNGNLNGMYIDAVKGFSFRSYKDNIIIGAGAHRTGKAPDKNPFKMIEKKGKMLFPDFKAENYWSAQDCITLDGLPYIGRFINNNHKIFISTGFNKWGMTTAMTGADIISSMICDDKNYDKSIFSPSRFSVFACAGNICVNTGETVKGFANHLKGTAYSAKDVKEGNAEIINYKGKKAGAYRCKGGKLYIVSLKCPHLKCCLQWNSVTKTWDCPCHGSRYDYKGNLIDNPAQQHSILIAEI